MEINNNSLMKFLRRVLILMSLLLATVTCAKAFKFKIVIDELPGKMISAITASDQKDEEIKKLQERFTTAAGDLKKKGIFAMPPPKKANPVKKVDGIMGFEALINNKWYKAGDSIGDAKLISVGTAEITVEWNGKKTKLSPISAPTKYAVVAKPKPVHAPKAVGTKAVKVVAEAKEEVKVVEAPVAEDPFAWIGVKMSPELRAKFLEQWNKMTDEQKEKAKSDWKKMPDDRKQQMVDQMEEYKDRM